MQLLTPGIGLLFWQAVIFVTLLLLLGKLAWNPILNALRIREDSIEEALATAERAKEEMAKLESDNKKLLDEARAEREKLLREARETASAIVDEAKTKASEQANKLINDAKVAIQVEKQAALTDVKNQVAEFSLEITEKVLNGALSDSKAQKAVIEKYVKDLNLN